MTKQAAQGKDAPRKAACSCGKEMNDSDTHPPDVPKQVVSGGLSLFRRFCAKQIIHRSKCIDAKTCALARHFCFASVRCRLRLRSHGVVQPGGCGTLPWLSDRASSSERVHSGFHLSYLALRPGIRMGPACRSSRALQGQELPRFFQEIWDIRGKWRGVDYSGSSGFAYGDCNVT